MSQEEVAALEAKIEVMSKEDYKEKHQKRWDCLVYKTNSKLPIADFQLIDQKIHGKCIHQGMENHYKEMEMTSLVFVCYTQPDGKLVIDVWVNGFVTNCQLIIVLSFDQIAKLMQVPSASFVDTYSNMVKDMKLMLLTYVK